MDPNPTTADYVKAKKLVDEKNRAWDERFLALAEHIAGWSKDPSTKVGAVITRPDRTISSVGYNGLPRYVIDGEERLTHRETKYEMIVHAEANAILHANERPVGYTIYTWPFQPCSRCAGLIIQSGLKRVVAPAYDGDRWTENFGLAAQMLAEAHVRLDLIRAKAPPVAVETEETPSYHDLHITTPKIPRTKISDLPYRVIVKCRRTDGWTAWAQGDGNLPAELLGGEYEGNQWLVLDVGGYVICDGRSEELKKAQPPIRATKRASSGFVCEPTANKCDCKPLTGDNFLFYHI